MNNIIEEVVSGNRNGFSNKEILQAHIQDDKEFKVEMRTEFKWIREQFGKGTGKITENRVKINSIGKILKYGVAPFMLLILGWLARVQIKP